MQSKININKLVQSIVPLTLKDWSKLEGLKRKVKEYTDSKDSESVYSTILQVFSIYPDLEKVEWDKVVWFEFTTMYRLVVEVNSPKIKLPILVEAKKEAEKLPWDYDGREWYFWVHSLASVYGWDLSDIEKLDIDTALALYQEIEVEKQFQREWEWSTTELAYPYNSNTKKSEYKKLDRPNWMLPSSNPAAVPKIKVRKDMMPVGLILDVETGKEVEGGN